MNKIGSKVPRVWRSRLFWFNFRNASRVRVLLLVAPVKIFLSLWSNCTVGSHYARIGDLNDYVMHQTHQLVSAGNGVTDIQPNANVRIGQDRAVFNYCPAVEQTVSFNSA